MNFLSKNIKHLRTLKGLTQEQFAEKLNVSRSRISSYEENRAMPSIDFLMELSDFFDISIDLLAKNDLTKATDLNFLKIGTKRVLFPISVDGQNEDLIEIIPAKASAGYLQGYADPEYIEQLQKIKLPFLPTGTLRAFPISGDSMLPVKSGSFVVAKFVDNIQEVKDGRTYIVLTKNDGLVYKRLYNKIKEKNCLELHSDNKAYQSFDVKTEDVIELWEFTCCINTQEYDEEELKLSSIMTMFQELRVELESISRK